ncbi:MAG: hypothetical protein JW829_01465, partial [Pirellulales bacterium]|nr:hypothetical protein [Pirellulales bacterium]
MTFRKTSMKPRHFLVDISHLPLAAFGLAASLAIAGASIASDPIPTPSASYPPDHPTKQLADSLTELLREAIPREYERKKDWGQTKRIPVGIQNTGHGLRLRIRKREKEVNHGIWKHYRISMIHPEENLQVQIENL